MVGKCVAHANLARTAHIFVYAYQGAPTHMEVHECTNPKFLGLEIRKIHIIRALKAIRERMFWPVDVHAITQKIATEVNNRMRGSKIEHKSVRCVGFPLEYLVVHFLYDP